LVNINKNLECFLVVMTDIQQAIDEKKWIDRPTQTLQLKFDPLNEELSKLAVEFRVFDAQMNRLRERFLVVKQEIDTKKYDRLLQRQPKDFTFQNNFDTNGILYYLGQREGTSTEYTNPCDVGFMECPPTPSTRIVGGRDSERYTMADFVSWKTLGKGTFYLKAEGGSQFSFMEMKFPKHSIKPNYYTIRHAEYDNYQFRNWKFEGSEDGQNWIPIIVHSRDGSLTGKEGVASWPIPGSDKFYQYFRLIQSDTNAGGDWDFMMAGFEIYGTLNYLNLFS